MNQPGKMSPNEQNLGRDCIYWNLGGVASNCSFPRFGLEGRTTCRGIIDDVCLFVKDGRTPSEFSQLLLNGIGIGIPDSSLLPPGEIV